MQWLSHEEGLHTGRTGRERSVDKEKAENEGETSIEEIQATEEFQWKVEVGVVCEECAERKREEKGIAEETNQERETVYEDFETKVQTGQKRAWRSAILAHNAWTGLAAAEKSDEGEEGGDSKW